MLTDILLETHLTYEGERGLVDATTLGEAYVRALCRDAADETVSGDPAEGSDALFYYYTVYKPTHAAEYPSDSASGADAARAALLSDRVRIYYSEGETYPRLRDEYAHAARAWLADGSKDSSGIDGETVANELTVAYADAIRAAKEEVASSHRTYRGAQETFLRERNTLLGHKWAELVIVYGADSDCVPGRPVGDETAGIAPVPVAPLRGGYIGGGCRSGMVGGHRVSRALCGVLQ